MYVGIDLGTSGVKAVVIDDDQRVVAEKSSRPLEVSRPHRGWSEQDPDTWWDAVAEAMDGLKTDAPAALAAVRGIGLSGQMYGATLLDRADRPLRPAILWNDTRTARECRILEERAPDVVSIAGRRPTPGTTATKLMWLKAAEPDAFDRVETVLLPKDYVRLKLTGDKASDKADSSGTLWMDVAARDWSDRLLAASGMERRQMPALYEGTEATGRLRPALAERWGMAVPPVVAAGGGDNACGACGTGLVRPGDGTVSLGTSGVLFVATDAARPSPDHAIETLCHAVPDVWHHMSVVLSATASLNWLAKLLRRPAADLIRALGPAPRPATALLFLPFLDGCWSPQADADVRGAFVGLSHGTGEEEMTAAVLQGVVFSFLEAADAFRANGLGFDRLLGIGGGSRSDLWLSMVATALGVTVAVPTASELGAAFGAARLGLIAATGAAPLDVLTQPAIAREVAPTAAHAAGYRAAFEAWHALYAPVRAASAALART